MNAHQLNALFRKEGLRVRIRRGNGYYYWLNEQGELVVDAESVYVASAGHLRVERWIALAREANRHVDAPVLLYTTARASELVHNALGWLRIVARGVSPEKAPNDLACARKLFRAARRYELVHATSGGAR